MSTSSVNTNELVLNKFSCRSCIRFRRISKYAIPTIIDEADKTDSTIATLTPLELRERR